MQLEKLVYNNAKLCIYHYKKYVILIISLSLPFSLPYQWMIHMLVVYTCLQSQ